MNGHVYPRYPRYKDSGIEWLGQIPEQWEVSPLFRLLRERFVRNTGNRVQDVLSLSYGRIVPRDVDSNFGLLPESFETYQIVEPGNIVLRLTDLQNDKRSLRVGHVGQRGIVTSAYVNLESAEGIDNRFAFHLLNAYDLLKVFYGMGAGVRQTMKFADLKRMPCVVPPRAEQESIAAFLDRETVKIDALIERQERLIERLEEKRKALISHAVTQGLNPNAKMKDSGVEWLGRIPEHWRVMAMGHFARLGNGSTPLRDRADYWGDGAFPWLNSSVVNDPVVSPPSQFVTDLALRECHLPRVQPGSVLVALTGEGKTRGMASLLPYEATINQHLAFITPRGVSVTPAYLRDSLASLYALLRFVSEGAGSTKGALTCEMLKGFKVPVPPLDEQRGIVARLDTETRRVTDTRGRVGQLIADLREKRTALIAAAVTGKIDVREAA